MLSNDIRTKIVTIGRVPVVVHVSDEQRVESIQVPTEHGKLISDGAALTVQVLGFALHTQVLLLCYHFARPLLQLLHSGDEVGFEHLWFGSAHYGLGKHCAQKRDTLT